MHIRRHALISWLEKHGFTAANVDAFIDAGTIPRHYFKVPQRGAVSKASKKQRPKLIPGRAWYKASEVAAIFEIPLP